MSSREAQAMREVGHTEVGRPTATLLTTAFLATVLAVPLLEIGLSLSHAERPVPATGAALRLPAHGIRAAIDDGGGPVARLLAGNRAMLAAIAALEDDLTERSAVGRAVRPWVQETLVAAGAGTEQVVLGTNDWLFFRPAVDHITGPGFLQPGELAQRARSGPSWRAPPAPDPRPAILDFRDQLATRGVELLLLPVPVKAAIQAGQLAPGLGADPTALANPSWRPFLDGLEAAGVAVLDPTPVLLEHRRSTGPAYLATDTHWTPEAMEAVARETAARIRALTGESSPGATPPAGADRQVTGRGDLAAMLDLPEGSQRFPPETVTVRPTDRRGPATEVLLLGDSFANIYASSTMGWGRDAGLAERLAAHLGAPVEALIRNDDGAFASRLELARELAAGRDLLAGKRVVVWELAARELSTGDWRSIELPRAGARSGFLVPPRGGSLEVRGVIAAMGELPDPASAPYADFLVALHLVELEGAGVEPGREALAFVCAMRGRRLLGGARLEVGDAVHLELRPWSDVSAELGTITRGEIFDPRLLLETPCWGEEIAP